ncbi:hypothetical protein SacmaDRAFT_2013 [Saccharomonospora marina XMU15]|uniref:Uncharacterized protein n=1 Tax=Saccharomonospora marina XMU15 TaxID=882083 RepID=H5X8H3_9PSEU|nr:hypothetical protein [Saccharomonospora marina]EHR50269.1 hypothetical protein SacmaDRAFT_2013 [Saccharomonospora marina XMU15]
MSQEVGTAPQQSRVDYRGTFGWPVQWDRGGLRLVTGSGVGAVVVPRRISDAVLASLARQGCDGPALTLPTRREMVTVLLVETDDFAVAEAPLPEGVQVLAAGSTVPLPDEHNPNALARWRVQPDPRQRWLPSLAAVLATISATGNLRHELLVW